MLDARQLLTGHDSSVRKGYRADTHRVVPPEQTLARLRPFLPQLGITRVANVTGLDRIGIPVVMVCRPNSRGLAVSQGKGFTLAAAKASGLMESIEAYHAERITLPLVYGSYEELGRTHRLIDVSDLNRPRKSVFHPDLPLLWVEGVDLLQQEPVWVPFELVHNDFTLPALPGSESFILSSNGLASGNHLLEAVSHGICEVVERDAVTLSLLSGKESRDRALLDLDTVNDPNCREVLDSLARAGVVVGVWESTSDVGVPCFRCQLSEGRAAPDHQSLFHGYGCHPSRAVALLRAVTEAVQSRLTLIAGSRDDQPRSEYETRVVQPSLPQDDPGLESGFPRRSFLQAPTWEAETFAEDVSWLLERLRSVGVSRVVVVDLTRPEFGLPVVRVIIPGTEVAVLHPGHLAYGQRARMVLAERA